jgi:2-polyprenyl-3-methyl-5-hydroxy-6-metoxy-1,4-benzoquinol methylase
MDQVVRSAKTAGDTIVAGSTDRPIYDYDAEYRRLRAAGLQGWAGSQRERNVARMAETLDRLERETFPRPPATVLELGCGNGMSSALWMAQKGYEVHGVDISETAIAWAEQQFAEAALYGSFRQGSVCEMPFFPEVFLMS